MHRLHKDEGQGSVQDNSWVSEWMTGGIVAAQLC